MQSLLLNAYINFQFVEQRKHGPRIHKERECKMKEKEKGGRIKSKLKFGRGKGMKG